MNLAPAGVALTFEVTYDSPALNVGMSVYDDTGASPVLVFGPSAMLSVVGNTYRGKFTPTLGRTYLVFKAVYTDPSLTVLDTDYSQASESFIAENVGGGGGAGIANVELIGMIDCCSESVGFFNC
jgi:hypothetical protein